MLANPAQGEVSFLCTLSNCVECIWGESGDDITGYGHAAGIEYEDRECMHMPPLTLAEFHKACHFACCMHYIFTVRKISRFPSLVAKCLLVFSPTTTTEYCNTMHTIIPKLQLYFKSSSTETIYFAY